MTKPLAARRRNAAATREAILDAARQCFQREAYEQVGVRAIAAEVGVDPALISRYFGSKAGLLAEVLDTTGRDPMEVLGGDRASFGRRVARELLFPSARGGSGMDFIQVATRASASSPAARRLVRRHIEKQFTVPFSAWLGGERAKEKAWLTACVLTGAVVMAAIDARTSRKAKDAAVEQLAVVLQAIVDGP